MMRKPKNASSFRNPKGETHSEHREDRLPCNHVPEAGGFDSPTSSTLLTIFVQKEKDKSVCNGDENSSPQGNPRLEKRNRD